MVRDRGSMGGERTRSWRLGRLILDATVSWEVRIFKQRIREKHRKVILISSY
jgi:hypothetical protein